MRPLLLFALMCSSVVARAGDVEFVRVWPGWKGVDDFKRISEYFNGVENTGKEKVERTKTDSRDGYYWVVRVANKEASMSRDHFVLKVITPDSPFPKQFTFPVDLPKGDTVFDLGLTGTDWSGRHVHPVAWRLELYSSDGTPLLAKDSFLWAQPQK